ncbi:hypothetical protein BC939DRAFT_455830 [Gamsiella multidivaricata]|uniref:uncharacterized protein n=1 Tax=Gamsiella multidivaricata TaxID=101098 RepID=UPI0022200F67|nr:uncharacterized protein BC939DRAFT_455830 [Gamsiella multidivaricata]KAI7821374.1 hypothetical protein BC939DRAFT_455830 [Gamsiella multidivaricata]
MFLPTQTMACIAIFFMSHYMYSRPPADVRISPCALYRGNRVYKPKESTCPTALARSNKMLGYQTRHRTDECKRLSPGSRARQALNQSSQGSQSTTEDGAPVTEPAPNTPGPKPGKSAPATPKPVAPTPRTPIPAPGIPKPTMGPAKPVLSSPEIPPIRTPEAVRPAKPAPGKPKPAMPRPEDPYNPYASESPQPEKSFTAVGRTFTTGWTLFNGKKSVSGTIEIGATGTFVMLFIAKSPEPNPGVPTTAERSAPVRPSCPEHMLPTQGAALEIWKSDRIMANAAARDLYMGDIVEKWRRVE